MTLAVRTTVSGGGLAAFALLIACEPAQAPTIQSSAPPSNEPASATPVASVEAPAPSATAVADFPVEAFDGKVHATVRGSAAPSVEVRHDGDGSPIVEIDIPVGTKHPVACVLRPSALIASDIVRRSLKVLDAYEWSTSRTSLRAEGSRLDLRFENPFREKATHELLGVERVALAVGPAGTIFCSSADEKAGALFDEVATAVFHGSGDFSEHPARYVELWSSEGVGGPDMWSVSTSARPDGGTNESDVHLRLGVENHRVRFLEVHAEIESDAKGEITNAVMVSRDEGTDDTQFAVTRQGPREYALGGSARGAGVGAPVKTSSPLVSLLSRAGELRSLSGKKSLSWSEFGGFAASLHVDVVREREARRSSDREVVITSKDEEETCTLSNGGEGPCDTVELRSKGSLAARLKRVYVSPK